MSDKAIIVAAGGLVVGGLLIFWAVQPSAPIMPDGPQVIASAGPVVDPDAMPAQNATAPAPAPVAPTTTAPAPQSQAAKIDTAESSNPSGESKYNKPSGPESRLTFEDERYGSTVPDMITPTAPPSGNTGNTSGEPQPDEVKNND